MDKETYNTAYKAFVKLKSQKPTKDDPKNQAEFCDKYSITPDQYKAFYDEPTLSDDILEATLNWAKTKTPEIIHILYDNIKTSGSTADIERYMNIIHELKKKKDERLNQYNQFNIFTTLPDDKFKKIALREIEK